MPLTEARLPGVRGDHSMWLSGSMSASTTTTSGVRKYIRNLGQQLRSDAIRSRLFSTESLSVGRHTGGFIIRARAKWDPQLP